MMKQKIIMMISSLPAVISCLAQDTPKTTMLDYDPEKLKIIPDKVFEFGIPLLFIFLLLNTIVTIIKNKAEHQLKLKVLEKGVSEETLIKIFKESNAIAKLQPLKWFLFTFSIGIALLVIHLCRNFLINQSGYLALGIFLLFISAAFLIYYNILSKKV